MRKQTDSQVKYKINLSAGVSYSPKFSYNRHRRKNSELTYAMTSRKLRQYA